jgi:hypothetical protein
MFFAMVMISAEETLPLLTMLYTPNGMLMSSINLEILVVKSVREVTLFGIDINLW